MNTYIIILGLVSLFFFIISTPLALGKIKPNRIYGYRTNFTLNNVEAWYSINKFYGKLFLLTSALYILFSVICLLYELHIPRNVTISLFLLHAIFPVIVSMIKTSRLKKELTDHKL
ncbi:SdpI family protein [Carnimonas bestiolae]|uniref:SdpI family protein n=1 Tax=Carnimonas bestiolae TaxID=3402172 RepID=UPI003F4A8AB2